MSTRDKIKWFGALLSGGALAWLFLKRQTVRVGVRGIYLNGLVSQSTIPLRVAIYLINDTIGSILIRSISCQLISNGLVVATISQNVNKRIAAHSCIDQDIFLTINNREALASLFENIQSGDISNISFTLDGEVVVGEKYPVGVKVNRFFTFEDIKQLL